MERNLAVFDFDHTIVDDNSDTAVVKLIDRTSIPKEVKALHRSSGWTAYMQGIFSLLHDHNKDQQDITTIMKNLPPVEGVIPLIKELNLNLNYDVIIISDSNSYFIDVWLEKNNLHDNILKVFTNPAKFVNGLLKIEMYHLQDSCKLSTKNLCKGQIMQDFIKEREDAGISYSKIIYVGDGMNDFCPILRLSTNDLACVRDKYKCVELVKKAQDGNYLDELGKAYTINASVCVWNTGFDILDRIQMKTK